MKMRTLKTIKPHKYGTRHLTAGEEYEVPLRHAVALVATKKARFADDKPMSRRAAEKSSKTSEEAFTKYMGAETITGHVGAMTSESTLDSLRLQATQLGIDVDGRWGAARLQHEIAQARR